MLLVLLIVTKIFSFVSRYVGQSQGVNFPIVQQLISRDPNKKMDAVKSEAAFKDADENKDGLLNITEFFSFEYPEFSLSVQRRYAERFLESHSLCNSLNCAHSFLKDHDRNGDGYVNSSEFLQTALQVKEPGQDKYSVQVFLKHTFVDVSNVVEIRLLNTVRRKKNGFVNLIRNSIRIMMESLTEMN